MIRTSIVCVALAAASFSSLASAQATFQPAAYTLPDGQPGAILPKDRSIKFLTRSSINSRTAQDADRIDLVVSEDVFLDDAIIIPRGTQATGEVWRAKPKQGWGSPGRLEIRLLSLNVEGHVVPITGVSKPRGASNLGGAVVSSFFTLSLPLGFAITGTSSVLPINTPLDGKTEFAVRLGGQEFRPTQVSGYPERRPIVQAEAYDGPWDGVLQRGTAVHFRLVSGLSSKVNDPGDLFELEVVDDVMVNVRIVIPRGSPAVGEVDYVRRKESFGRQGRIVAQIRSLRINGIVIGMTGPLHAVGDKNIGGAVGVALPVGYFITGTSAYLPAGAMMLGVTDRDVSFRPFGRGDLRDHMRVLATDDGHLVARGGGSMQTAYQYTPAIVELHTAGY